MNRIASLLLIILLIICLLQSCSWKHEFSIKNDTDQSWTIRYQVLDDRGVFKKEIKLYQNRRDEPITKVFEDGEISFELPPGYTAQIGTARNAHYRYYGNRNRYDKEVPWAAFINIDRLVLQCGEETYRRRGNDLKDWLKKNNRGFAQIKLSKLLPKS